MKLYLVLFVCLLAGCGGGGDIPTPTGKAVAISCRGDDGKNPSLGLFLCEEGEWITGDAVQHTTEQDCQEAMDLFLISNWPCTTKEIK